MAVAPMNLGKHKRVALIIDSMTAPRRAMMNGVARHMQEHGAWSIYLKPPFVATELAKWLQRWHGDGVIGILSAPDTDVLRRAGIPFVEAGSLERGDGFHVVRADDCAIGAVGAEHLLERGFKHFAFVELATFWSQRRREGFEARLARAGFSVRRHEVLKPSARPGGPDSWDEQQVEMAKWIAGLPKPVAIMATTDFLGRQVLEACQRIGVGIPDTVAVLGADNDVPICRLSTPPLSSVIIDDEQRGYQAAAVLDELMNGQTPASQTVRIGPAGVETRGSTDVLALDDELLVAAMRYLREHVEASTSVEDLAHACGVSRSTLNRRFRRTLGRSVNDELVRLRVNHAARLLAETRLPLKSIALRCGFSSQSYMSTVFKAKLGKSPTFFRR